MNRKFKLTGKRSLFAVVTVLILVLSLTACGGGSGSGGDSSGDTVKIKVGASPAPHAEILEAAAPLLAEKGVEIEIIEFTDYVLPNIALWEGDIDANFFQHQPYLDKFNAENDMDIKSISAVHFEPLGIYPGNSDNLSDIREGALIGVPSDTSNEARALILLEELGIIKLKAGVGLEATPIDIAENPHKIEIFEIEAAQLVNTLPDLDFAVINGNYAVDAGIIETALAFEEKDGLAAQTYANIIAVKDDAVAGTEGIKALKEVLGSDEIRSFIQDKYKGVFVAAF